MRKLVFWVSVPFCVVLQLVMGIMAAVSMYTLAAHEVTSVLLFRFELWSKGYPKGVLLNCPWKKTISEVWKDAVG